MSSLKKVGFLVGSVAIAMSVLGLLLAVATTPLADQLRLAATHIDYLNKAVATAEAGVELAVRGNSLADSASNEEFTQLDTAMVAGSDTLIASIEASYRPIEVLDQARLIGIHALNWQDANTPVYSQQSEVIDLTEALVISINRFTEFIANYREEQIQFTSQRQTFNERANELLTTLRERGDERTADTIYVIGNKVEQLLVSGVDTDLDQVFVLNGQLEHLEQTLPSNLRAALRNQINTIYALNALKRSMNEAVSNMNTSGVTEQLTALNTFVSRDHQYVSGAVSDARILLNISTILLLGLLVLLGRRLQSSYSALNASHDDLEVRVEERTSDLAQANDDLKESQVQLVQAEKMSSLGQLVAGVMHEINTPLLYVQNNTTMTAEAIADITDYVNLTLPLLTATTSDEIKETLAEISRRRQEIDANDIQENLEEVASLATDSVDGLGQISELVQSLKDFSRLDRVADDKFDVRDGIEKTLVITRNLLKQGVEVVQHLADVPEIYCSPSRLNQVFINLVTNSVQAMDGSGTLTIHTQWLRKNHADESVEIIFEDTGCGIAEEHLNKIMDPFFTTKPVGQGTGLGLSIVRQIVDQHKGQILIDSKVGVGTRITLNFPTSTRGIHDKVPGSNSNEEEAA